MTRTLLTSEGAAEFEALPLAICARVAAVFERLGSWPEDSWVKWLRGEWAGHARIRVGDWRVIFTFVAPGVVVVRIRHRREVFEETRSGR